MANPQREHPNTYIVADRSNQDELNRLQLQDHLITTAMGGVLPEQQDTGRFHHVLDVGCGTGDWLIEAAQTYPTMTELVGVDVSGSLLDFARAQADARSVADRVTFRTMDALRMLEFPAHSFDLVNMRFGMSYLRKWDWPKILQEFQRISKAGGTIRITDLNMRIESSSPTVARLNSLFSTTLAQAGHSLSDDGQGITDQLAGLLHQFGFQDVQTHVYICPWRAGTPGGELFRENMAHLYRTIVPFLRKWTRVPDDYQELCQQALADMEQPDFFATWQLLTAWGRTN